MSEHTPPPSFLHVGDCHLGYRQYGLDARAQDFASAFESVVSTAIDKSVDLLLITGDLFDKRDISPSTYLQAYELLLRLRDDDIAVLAIEGNHDQPYYTEQSGWLDALEEQGLLHLFKKSTDEGHILTAPYDLHGTRIWGVPYIGASTKRSFQVIADDIQEYNASHGAPEKTVLLMHFGLTGMSDKADFGGEDVSSIQPLKPVVDYLALGHFHKAYEHDGWVYNGGSLEVTSMDDYPYRRGVYLIDDHGIDFRAVDDLHPDQRPFISESVCVDKYDSPDTIYGVWPRIIQSIDRNKAASEKAPIVHIDLTGTLQFPPALLDIKRLESMVSENLSTPPLLCRVRLQTITDTIQTIHDSTLSRKETEYKILGELIETDTRYTKDTRGTVDLILQARDLALERTDPQTIREHLTKHMGVE